MAQDTVTILIKDGTTGNGVPSSSTATAGANASDSRTAKASDILNVIAHPLSALQGSIKSMYGAAAGAVAAQLVSTASNVIRANVSYSYNKQFQLSANYIAKRDVDYTTNAIQGGVSLGETALSGAVAGFTLSGGHVVGAVVGAALAATGSLIMSNIKSDQAYDQQRISIAVNNTETAFARSRYEMGGSGDDWGRGTDN